MRTFTPIDEFCEAWLPLPQTNCNHIFGLPNCTGCELIPRGASGVLLLWTLAFRKCWNNNWKTGLVMAEAQFCSRNKPLARHNVLKVKLWERERVRMSHARRPSHTQCFYVKCDTQGQTHKFNSLYTQVVSYSQYSNCLCAEELDDVWLTNRLPVCPFQTATCLSAITEGPVRRPSTLQTTSVSVPPASVGLSVRSVSSRQSIH